MHPAVRAVVMGERWTPSLLFRPGDTGDWWDVSKSTRIWTTSGATVNAGNSDVVGRIDGLKNGNNLTQSTSANKPIRNLVNGRWNITGDGSNDFLQGLFTVGQPFTRINAGQQVAWTSGRGLWGGGTNGGLNQTNASPQVQTFAGSFGPSSTAMAIGADHVVTEIVNGASSNLAIDNGSYATADAGATAAGGFTACANSAGASASMKWYGGIVISRVLSTAEIAKCRTYFGRLAGLSL